MYHSYAFKILIFFLTSFANPEPRPTILLKTTTFPFCPARPVRPARCRKSIMFRGSSTMKTCLMSGEKSSPLESKEVVISTWGIFLGSLKSPVRCVVIAFDLPTLSEEGEGNENALALTRKKPSRWRLFPLCLDRAVPVKATVLISRSSKNSERSSTLLLLLQNTSTFDRIPNWPSLPLRESSAQTLRIRLSISVFLFPPDQSRYSVLRDLGKWCRFGEASLVIPGWYSSRYDASEDGIVAVARMRLNGYAAGVDGAG